MNSEEFNKCIEEQIERCRSTLIKKSGYGSPKDRLHNFQTFAGLAGITPEQAFGGFLGKHIVSIYDMRGTAARIYSLSMGRKNRRCDKLFVNPLGDYSPTRTWCG